MQYIWIPHFFLFGGQIISDINENKKVVTHFYVGLNKFPPKNIRGYISVTSVVTCNYAINNCFYCWI